MGSAFVLLPGGVFEIEGLPPGPVSAAWLSALFAPDLWEVGIRFRGFAVPSLVMLCSDLGAVHASRARPGFGLSFVRPWDSAPIFGPLVLLSEQRGPEGLDLFGLGNGEALKVSEALQVFGWRMPHGAGSQT